MNQDACQQYLEDPEANAAHLRTCAECRAVNAGLTEKADAGATAGATSINVDALPLAPWEGSSHRPWPLVLGVAAVVVAVA
ncbi:MAG: hypothetical protein ACRD3J_16500, partial [Thermoanaerobaculia bacterium]